MKHIRDSSLVWKKNSNRTDPGIGERIQRINCVKVLITGVSKEDETVESIKGNRKGKGEGNSY